MGILDVYTHRVVAHTSHYILLNLFSSETGSWEGLGFGLVSLCLNLSHTLSIKHFNVSVNITNILQNSMCREI